MDDVIIQLCYFYAASFFFVIFEPGHHSLLPNGRKKDIPIWNDMKVSK